MVLKRSTYGWASDDLSERWHICRDLHEAVNEATGGIAEGGVWICQAHKVLVSELLSDALVETLMESLDEKAGETVGIDDHLFRCAGSDWHDRIAKTRKLLAPMLDQIWTPTLWYHEVDMVAPLTLTVGTIDSMEPQEGDWVGMVKGHALHLFSGIEKHEGMTLLGLNRGFMEVTPDTEIRMGRIGKWKRFGS